MVPNTLNNWNWTAPTLVEKSKSTTWKVYFSIDKRQARQGNFTRSLEEVVAKIGSRSFPLKMTDILWCLSPCKPRRYIKLISTRISERDVSRKYGYFELSNKGFFWSRKISNFLFIKKFVLRTRRSNISSLKTKSNESSIVTMSLARPKSLFWLLPSGITSQVRCQSCKWKSLVYVVFLVFLSFIGPR